MLTINIFYRLITAQKMKKFLQFTNGFKTVARSWKTAALFFICLFVVTNTALAQKFNVDPLTGRGSMVIPIYQVTSGQAVLPVSLVYSATGIKPADVEGTAGMGWQLQAGGQVSRLVRGLPDDVTQDNSGAPRLGWMSASNTGAAFAGTFTPANNGGATCSYETSDIAAINNNMPYTDDTEPDLFYVSAPGLSCELVYDRATAKFHTVSYQDILISYTTNPGTGSQPNQITSFTITNDKGIVYSFGTSDTGPSAETVSQYTSGGSHAYFATKFKQYQNGITYYDSWALSSITDPNGNAINLNYASYPPRSSTDSSALYIGGSSSSSLQYFIKQTVTPMELTSVQTFNGYTAQYLTFNWTTFNSAEQTGQTAISSIVGMGRNFQFNYSQVVYTPSSYTRNFLRSFTEPGCSTPVNYTFAYAGETLLSGTTYTTLLPDSSSNKTDYWGYYSTAPGTSVSQIPSVLINPGTASFPRYLVSASGTYGAAYNYYLGITNRMADQVNIATGSLTAVNYVQGGNTSIVYEPNDYYDASGAGVVQGGGLRVKQVTESPGSGASNNIVRNYSYSNPATGYSSGKPMSLPQYAFTIPYSGSATGNSLWTAASALSAHDLSQEDHTIMYAYSRVSQTGAGSTLYQFYLPATYYDASATPGCSGCTTTEWYPTVNDMGRNNCSSGYGPVSNYTYAYPFIPNPNYDFERGLLQKVTAFNDAGAEVSESDYTYTRSYPPTGISAFKYDQNPNVSLLVYGYNKYIVYYNTSELTATVTKKVFDSNTLSQAQTSTISYTYGSPNHKLVTQEAVTNSDNSTVTTNISYVKDFASSAGSNANVNALYYLRSQNINAPIETYQVVGRGGSNYVTGASLTLFSAVNIGSVTRYLPSQQLKFAEPSGLLQANFNPYSVSGQTSAYDTRYYFPVANFDQYDNTGYPETVDDANRHVQTSFFDHLTNHTTVAFSNAYWNQVAFQDFDSKLATGVNTFTISGSGSYAAVGSHTGNAAGLATTQTVTSSTIATNLTGQNYIFSIWINPSATGTLTLKVAGTGTSVGSITFTSLSWSYYEVKIPVSSLGASFSLAIQASANIAIDDLLLYPDVSEATTAAFDPTGHYKTAQTNTNGVSAYFTNDAWGRVTFAFDQDKNIVQKNTYLTPADVSSFSNLTIGASNPVSGQPAGFGINGPDACASEGTTVNWNFGDGTTTSSAGLTSPSHTYTYSATGNDTYTVSATVVSPLFGTFTPAPVNVTVQPANIPITYTNYTFSYGNITSVTFTPTGTGGTYTFTGSNLNGAHVPQGKYTIAVSITGGKQYSSGTGAGYSCLYLNGSCNSACSNFVANNTYTFVMDLSGCTTFNFTVSQYTCSYFGGGAQ
jgi:hypothetical protein